MTEKVSVDILEGGALMRVTFEKDKGNILTAALMRQLDSTLAEHANDKNLKMVTLEGAGKNFSFGASIEEHQKDRAPELLETFHGLVRRIVKYPLPVAAVVRGRALGGGFEVALACRFVFTEAHSSFSCPEIKLGVVPPVLAALGPQRVGFAWTQRLLLGAMTLEAKTAHELGFVTEIAAEGTDPYDNCLAWYRHYFADLSAFTLRQATDAVRIGAGTTELIGERLARIEKLYIERLLPSHDGNEGLAAFLEKRKPEWRNE